MPHPAASNSPHPSISLPEGETPTGGNASQRLKNRKLLRVRPPFLYSLPLLFTLFLAFPFAHAETPTPGTHDLQAHLDGVFKRSHPAVVRVRACDDLGIRLGSGFFIDPAGTVYTHSTVVAKAHEVRVIFNDRALEATIVASDERSGIAILKTDCVSPFLAIGDSSSVRSGTPILSIGYPEEFDVTPSLGMIANREKHHLGTYFSTSHLRANLAVHRGQGGSPVLGMDGKVVGMVVSQIVGGASCYILPIEAAEKVRHDIIRFGEPRPGWVGVEVEESPEPIMGSTALISSVAANDSRPHHGLREGDTVLQIGNHPVATSEDVLDASYFLTAGDATEIKIVRDGAPLTISVKPMLHPTAARTELHASPLHQDAPTLR